MLVFDLGKRGGRSQTLTYSVSGRKRHWSRKLYPEGNLFVLIKSSEFPLSPCRREEAGDREDRSIEQGREITFAERKGVKCLGLIIFPARSR